MAEDVSTVSPLLSTLKKEEKGKRVFLCRSFPHGSSFAAGPLNSDLGDRTFVAAVAYQARGRPKTHGKVELRTTDNKDSARRVMPLACRHGFYLGGHDRRRPVGVPFEIATLFG